MTAFSFILGVLPLVVASGAGAEARVVMGVALLGGMALATILGVFSTPCCLFSSEKLPGMRKKEDFKRSRCKDKMNSRTIAINDGSLWPLGYAAHRLRGGS
jgi:HAE1 family hydrophobic/amphiphilic exporter-1